MDYAFLKTAKSTMSDIMDIPTFLGTLFQFRDRIHLAHLATNSYAIHKATEKLYEVLLDHIDTLCETQQSNELLKITIIESQTNSDGLGIVEELISFIEKNRNIFLESYSQQILDNIIEVSKQTLYRIKMLK